MTTPGPSGGMHALAVLLVDRHYKVPERVSMGELFLGLFSRRISRGKGIANS